MSPISTASWVLRDARPRGGPVLGGELEIATARPVGQDVDDLGEVALGVEPVELTGRDEREEVGGGAGVIVGAEKQPRFSSDGDAPQGALALVARYRQPAVVEEATQSCCCRTA